MQKSFEQKDRFSQKKCFSWWSVSFLVVTLGYVLKTDNSVTHYWELSEWGVAVFHGRWRRSLKDEEWKKNDSYNESFLLLFCFALSGIFYMQWFLIRQTLIILYNYLPKMTWGRGRKGSFLFRFITSLGVRATSSVMSPEPSTGMDHLKEMSVPRSLIG